MGQNLPLERPYLGFEISICKLIAKSFALTQLELLAHCCEARDEVE